MITATIPDARLARLADSGSPHLRPLYAAMRGGRVSFLFVRQGKDRFHRPAGRPFVAIIGDDMDQSLGPDSFHGKSLTRLLREAHGAVLISCAIIPSVYATVAHLAALGRSTVIVETQPEQEGPWLERLQRVVPKAALLICTTFEGTA